MSFFSKLRAHALVNSLAGLLFSTLILAYVANSQSISHLGYGLYRDAERTTGHLVFWLIGSFAVSFTLMNLRSASRSFVVGLGNSCVAFFILGLGFTHRADILRHFAGAPHLWGFDVLLVALGANFIFAFGVLVAGLSKSGDSTESDDEFDFNTEDSGMPVPIKAPIVKAPIEQRDETPESTPLSTRDTEVMRPKLNFSKLHGNAELKSRLLVAATEWKAKGKNGILFYGEPGTGKTVFAEALAGELKLPIMKVNFGSVASRWINQTTEQFQHIIDSALRQAPCVLFMDELDTILPDRAKSNGQDDGNKVVTVFLTAIEKLKAGGVLLIAATNLKESLDEAAIRPGRFDFHMEVPLPDFDARKGLILMTLNKAKLSVDESVLKRLTTRWGGFNVPRICEAAERAGKLAIARGVNTVEMTDFFAGLRNVQGNKAGAPEGSLSLNDLFLDVGVRDQLGRLATQFAHVDEIEAGGGSFPKGVVFYGPPGTGKTTMAKVLAKESGWTFIATSGRELLEHGAIKKLGRKASDLRPAIVFIDEADDILGHRQFSGAKAYTNELFTLMEGANGMLHDVVWVAATNDLDGFDEAAQSRFNQKIELPIPGREPMKAMIHDWAAKIPEKIDGDAATWSGLVVDALEGLPPRNIMDVLRMALNNDIADNVSGGKPVCVTVEDVLSARKEMRL